MVPKNLASERTRLDMNQAQLAEILGVGKSSIIKWEKDISKMPSGYAEVAADLFGCSVDYLVGRTEERLMLKNADQASREKLLSEQSA